MSKKITEDALQIFSEFQEKVLKSKPTISEMTSEIRMMQFKIRPLQGNISLLNLKNRKFIEIVWSLGKMDEFFLSHMPKVRVKERQMFIKIFDNLYNKFQNDLNKISFRGHSSNSGVFELEIYRERTKKFN
ncbi:hypothetical protein HGB07_08240 [Candidatus Roizmanbacteria bacterium]|nr:hypothetical protein [Candidatus Roizmanbacteria bacterium]